MKRSYFLTMGIAAFVFCLILLPMQNYKVMAQSYDEEQQEDLLTEPDETYLSDETYPSEGLEQNDSDSELGQDSLNEEYPDDEHLTDDQPTDEYPLDELPTEEYPPNELPTEEYPTDELPMNELPTNEYPTDELPMNELPANEYPTDELPTEEYKTDSSVDAVSSPGAAASQTAPAKCSQAAGHVLYLLSKSSFGGSVSYLKPGARITFQNSSNVTFQIQVIPSTIVTSSSFSVPAGSKIDIFASSSSQLETGSIYANAGSGDMVEDIVKCP